jgi:hypothetical protein
VSVQLRLAATVATASAPAFRRQFESSVATSIGINASRVSVTDVLAGSAIMIVAIASSDAANATSAASSSAPPSATAAELQQLASALVAQAANPSSSLVVQVAAQTGAQVDTSFQPPPPALAYTCWDGSSVPAPTACPATAPTTVPTTVPPSQTAAPDSEAKSLGVIVYVGAGAALLAVTVVLVYCWYRKRRSPLSYRTHGDDGGTRFDDDGTIPGPKLALDHDQTDARPAYAGLDLLPRTFAASHDHAPNLEMQVRELQSAETT